MSHDLGSTLLHFLTLFESEFASANISNITIPKSIESLSDGVYLSQLLHLLEPNHFDLENLSTDDKQSNISNLLVNLETFFEDSMAKPIDLTFLNVNNIVQNQDVGEIIKLLELTILCAINTTKKEEVVNQIMSMDESSQHQLMFIINDTMTRFGGEGGGNNTSGHRDSATSITMGNRASIGDIDDMSPTRLITNNNSNNSSNNNNKELIANITKLETQRDELNLRVTTLERENRDFQRKENELKSKIESLLADKESEMKDTIIQAINAESNKQAEIRKQEAANFTRTIKELEHRLNEMKIDFKKLQEQNLIQQREKVNNNEALEEAKTTINQLKDELQVAVHKAEQTSQLEAKLSRLQARLDAAGDIKAAADYAEEQASKNMEKILLLETQNKEIPNLKQTIQKYKEQIINQQQQILELNLTIEQKTSDLSELKTELLNINNEMKQIQSETKTLKEDNTKLNNKLRGNNDEFDSLHTGMGPSLKETNKRLEFELKQLKQELENKAVSGEIQNELDIAKTMAESSQTKYIEATRKINQLEQQLRKQSGTNNNINNNNSNDPQQLLNNNEEINKLKKELATAQETIAKLQKFGGNIMPSGPASMVSGSNSTISGLTSASAALSATETVNTVESLTIRNKKLETFVKHTQKKIKLLEAELTKNQSEILSLKENNRLLKASLNERDKEIAEREKTKQEDTQINNRERRLMSSAFYALGMDFQNALLTGKAVHNRNIINNSNSSSSNSGNNNTINNLNVNATPTNPRSWLSQQRITTN